MEKRRVKSKFNNSKFGRPLLVTALVSTECEFFQCHAFGLSFNYYFIMILLLRKFVIKTFKILLNLINNALSKYLFVLSIKI